ncbi:MAG: hypothetical protein ACRD23_13660 [Terriglobales bacterium]
MLPGRIQWLAVAAGCATGIALLGVSWVLSLVAILLIIGAAVSRGFPRAGKWFILAPALLLSVMVLPFCIANLVPLVKDISIGPHDFNFVVMSLAWLLSPVLLISCIAAVVKHSRRLV